MSDDRAQPRTLLGRSRECAVLHALIEDLGRGESRSFVLRGEAGIGKTALLDFLTESASQTAVDRADGVESEMELPYASLHQLCVTGLLSVVQVDDAHVVERRPAEHVV